MPLGANKAAIMGVAGVSTGDVVLIQSQTASDDATLDFTSGIDSTYGEYIFKFYNIPPETDRAHFKFQVNASDATGYNETVTSTSFRTLHYEDDSGPVLEYMPGEDEAQETDFLHLVGDLGNVADESAAGELHLFNPSSTTYVKHWYSDVQCNSAVVYLHHSHNAGYINTTTAIDEVQFKLTAGNMNGTIKMWGVK